MGKPYTADELLKSALRYRTYWGKKGGITVSGGEPLLQIEFLTELFQQGKSRRGCTRHWIPAAIPYTEEEPFYSKWLELMKVHRSDSSGYQAY